MSKTTTINREAADKAKGPRLQKLRAAKLMLEALEYRPRAFFYAAVEAIEDVAITISDNCSGHTYLEEDKNYDADKNFTIFSESVKNTLVSFFDIVSNNSGNDDNVILAFYTTAGIGKERKSGLDDGTILKLPDDPILEILCSGSIDKTTSEIVKAVLVEEYSKQYKDKASNGHLETLKTTSIPTFTEFLQSIKWFFADEDEEQLKQTVLSLIRNSRLYSFKVAKKEETILALILEMLDSRQNLALRPSRFVTDSDIRVIFHQAEAEECSDVLDPVWKQIQKLEAEKTDKRNLEEKILSVNPDYPIDKIKYLARLACRSKLEQAEGNKSFVSLKYRVYEACEEYFCNGKYIEPNTTALLDDTLKKLQEAAIQSIEELKKDYTYTISNAKAIQGVVIDLVDSCFISFDQHKNGK